MECPYCGGDSRVLDSRRSGDDIRRRRECLECKRRFTTYETVAPPEIKVKKRSGTVEDFNRQKILKVVRRLTRDRPIAEGAKEALVRGLEAELVDQGIQTIPSWKIAERVLERLRALDRLVAERFAADFVQEDGSIRLHEEAESPQMELPDLGPAETPAEPERPAPEKPRRRGGRPRARKPRR